MWLPLGLVAVGLIAPVFITSGQVYVASGFLVAILFAVATSFVIGFAGVPTFGQQAFYGAGAYLTASLVVRWHWHDQILLLGAAGLVGLALALPMALLMRGKAGLTFGLLTLAIAQAIYLFVYQGKYLYGEAGLSAVYRGEVFGIGLGSGDRFYYFTFVVVGFCFLLMLAIRRSMVGRVIWAIRENPQRVASLGVPIARYRIIAFATGAIFTAVSGSLLAQLVEAVDPSLFYWTAGANPILSGLIGGIRTIWGPVLGAIILQAISYFVGQASTAWVFWLGLTVVILYLVWPDGILVGLRSDETKHWLVKARRAVGRIRAAAARG